MSTRFFAGLLAGLLVIPLAGCGGPARTGPPLYPLSGTATYGGKPIPRGGIELVPAEGAATVVTIHDGQYRTPDDRGIVGGTTQVTIYGFDGVPVETGEGSMDETGSPLFPPHKMTVDLPKAAGTYNFEVPGKN